MEFQSNFVTVMCLEAKQQQQQQITQSIVESERGEDCGDLDLAAQA